MRLVNFEAGGALRFGVWTPEGIVDVASALQLLALPEQGSVPTSVEAALAGGSEARASLADLALRTVRDRHVGTVLLDELGLQLAPPVTAPGKIICVGFNYRSHTQEASQPLPETPVLFSKFNNALAASGMSIPLPASASQYDYEAELAVVIGRRAWQVEEGEALGFVGGYCCANDVSARDLQFRSSQFLLGKTLDGFLPLGPFLVTADEVPDPQSLRVRCWLNGELRQDASSSDMIFPVARLVSYISRYIPLDPGDLIVTGTPEGVIHFRTDKRWIRPGDEVVVEVEGLGRLRNTFRPA